MPTITVAGEASLEHAAETGTVRLRVSLEGPDREDILQKSVVLHGSVRDGIAGHHADGNVTVWTADQVRVSSYKVKPNDDGEEAWIRHRADASLTACFTDFPAMEAWLTRIAGRPGLSVDGITWELTETTRGLLDRQVRKAAVMDAVRRADDYTAHLAADECPRLTAIYEKGLRPATAATPFDGGPARTGAVAGASPGLVFELKPRDIRVTASVTADFSF